MRSLKSTGGLTRGRSMIDMQRLIWLLSMPTCAQINECMQDLTGLTYSTNYLDTQAIIFFLALLELFNEILELCNIVTGMTASTGVNVDSAKEVGLRIINDMTGKAADTYTFRKKDNAVNMTSQAAVKIDREKVCIDQTSLFQCLIPWKLGTTYDTICDTYVKYIIKHFGKAFIVFDGYCNGHSSKDITRLQRTKGLCGSIWFFHAFLGCDTTSTIFGVGKQVVLTLALSDKQFQQASVEFCKPALACVYKGRLGESLPSLRLRLFIKKVASSSTFVEPQRIPPTRAAAKFNFLRAYLQIME
ncbi:hypothetical protein PR048_022055 [Dryococelus australis]|uniref:Uncharacterized protein n=1 Tax=Dryococelus australis TaxID=614101 RepID=A0ABQ9H007_9NEOP|nr:hypothetical protein PR048_022055 [Dryococelus australis]